MPSGLVTGGLPVALMGLELPSCCECVKFTAGGLLPAGRWSSRGTAAYNTFVHARGSPHLRFVHPGYLAHY
jgi:hypothetical protein